MSVSPLIVRRRVTMGRAPNAPHRTRRPPFDVDAAIDALLAAHAEHNRTKTAGQNIELELRLRPIPREAFESAYTAALSDEGCGTPTLECSINFISKNIHERVGQREGPQYIRRLTFIKGMPAADEYMEKTQLMRPVIVPGYTEYALALSRESPVSKFSSQTDARVRIKARVSFEYTPRINGTPAPKWRFDMTAVRSGQLDVIGPMLKDIKTKLFTAALAPDNFLRELNHEQIDAYEIEVEYIGTDPVTRDDLHIIDKVFSLINPRHMADVAYQTELRNVAKYIVPQEVIGKFARPENKLKQLVPQVVSLSKDVYYAEVYPPDGYFLTDKADGERVLVSINGGRARILRADTMIEAGADNITAGEITIADAELVGEALYIFDVLVLRDEDITQRGFDIRVGRLAEAAEIITRVSGWTAAAKKFVHLAEPFEDGFREIWEQGGKRPYDVDGLILTTPGEPYAGTTNYKWKPYERNTIDFLAVKCPREMLGIAPYMLRDGHELYLLFVGISAQARTKLGLGFIKQYRKIFPGDTAGYMPIQFSPSAAPFAYLYWHAGEEQLDRTIIELGRVPDNPEWVFHRRRTDRTPGPSYFGNDFRVAEMTYSNFIDPFEFDDLFHRSTSYFTKTASDMYSASNKFKRFVISLIFKENLAGSKWIIDEAAGRGADLHRYQEIGVSNALFIDVDPTAIAELIRRKFSFFAAKRRQLRTGGAVVTKYDRVMDVQYDQVVVKDIKALTVHTLVADLKQPPADLVAAVRQFGIMPGEVDGVVCNFALHYMCDTIEHLRGLLSFNAGMLKIGGLFMFTVMDGAAVAALLADLPKGGTWESRTESGHLKYAIRRDYAGDKLAQVGQMISVLLPFSDQMYAEPLCNVEVVIAEAKKVGLDVEINMFIGEYFDKFARVAGQHVLTDEDKKYNNLHKVVTLRKTRVVQGGRGRR